MMRARKINEAQIKLIFPQRESAVILSRKIDAPQAVVLTMKNANDLLILPLGLFANTSRPRKILRTTERSDIATYRNILLL